ncbi:MAG: hypothetical protein ACOC80_10515 [Petrotogales bacterium]
MRQKHEYELRDILVDNGFFVVRSAGSTDCDLIAIKNNKQFIFEIKSKNKKTIYLNRHLDQLKDYYKIMKQYKIPVIYAQRYVTRKNVDYKWALWDLRDKLPTTKNGNPKLELNNGLTIKEWMEREFNVV